MKDFKILKAKETLMLLSIQFVVQETLDI